MNLANHIKIEHSESGKLLQKGKNSIKTTPTKELTANFSDEKMTRTTTTAYIVMALTLTTSALSTQKPGFLKKTKPLPVYAGSVDLARYQGLWYEQASLPIFNGRNCVCSTATYLLNTEGNKISALNQCEDKYGHHEEAHLSAVPDNAQNTKLTAYFGPFGAPYWILDIGTDYDYDYVVVGQPSRSGFWILSRKPIMEADLLKKLVALAEGLGFDVKKLRYDQSVKCYGNKVQTD